MTACVVDAPKKGFQCSRSGVEFFLSLDDGKDLQCTPPYEAEIFFKACKQGKVTQVTHCILKDDINAFSCITPEYRQYEISVPEADNYYCMTLQHFNRVIDRCKNQESLEDL